MPQINILAFYDVRANQFSTLSINLAAASRVSASRCDCCGISGQSSRFLSGLAIPGNMQMIKLGMSRMPGPVVMSFAL